MKLLELAAINPTKQAAKVFESYFGGRVNINTITRAQAHSLLNRVRTLVKEHRRTPEFHYSEQNPSYLKLMMMEQVLSAKVREDAPIIAGQPPAVPGAAPVATNPQAAQAMQAAQLQQKTKVAKDQAAAIDKQIQQLTQQKSQLLQQANNPTMAENRRQRKLREASEIQQAQVVLASQDMVDQVQKMIEQVTSMQFKDLPALVDQIKNEVGVDQAGQFNNDANAALGGLVQNLQGSKQQLEQALGVVTGQAPQIPGQELGGEMTPPTEEVPAELPAPDVDAEMDANLEVPTASLGRGRR